MPDLRKGHIVYFNYKNYHRDPSPLALILYADDKIVHCINLHYLSSSLSDELIEMIALIAGRWLDGNDTYKLYHRHMKQYLPGVLQAAYRTYKPKHIHNHVYVSKGFNAVRYILTFLKDRAKPQKINIIKTQIQKEINVAKTETPEELREKYGAATYDDILERVEDYYQKIKSVIKPKLDPSKYTGLRYKK